MFKNNKPLKIINSIKILYKISLNWFFIIIITNNDFTIFPKMKKIDYSSN